MTNGSSLQSKPEAQVGTKTAHAVLDAEREARAAEADLLGAEAALTKVGWLFNALSETLSREMK